MRLFNIDLTSNTIKVGNTEYKADWHVQTFLEKMFATKFEKVFVDQTLQITKTDLNVGCRTIIILKKDGRILRLTNSE